MCLRHTGLIQKNQRQFIFEKWGNDDASGRKEWVVQYLGTRIGCKHSLN
jgi:hypothetical protein